MSFQIIVLFVFPSPIPVSNDPELAKLMPLYSAPSCLNKEPLMDGIGHCVETWFAFFGKQHLVYNAFKLCTSIAKDPKLIFIQIT